MNLFDLYENREPYQQAIDKLEQRRIEDLEAKMDDYAQRGMKDEFQKCKAERDSYHKIKETHDTTEKDSQGHATGFSHEGDWKKIPKNKAGRPVDPRGEVTHLSDLARREAERAAQDDVAEGAGEFLYKKLRPSQYGGVDVVGFKQAPRNSVLSGQVLKHFIDSYETEEEALKAHPDAEGYSNQYTDPQVSLRHLPGEDDPVAGGMYPDDIDEQGMAEGKADYNFDIEDLKRLEHIRDLPTLKTQALALISKPSTKPMRPEKVEWFKNALERMNSPLKVIKLMYDLLLSGEGHAVLGSKSSMNPNSYRQRFGEQDIAEGTDSSPVAGAIVNRIMRQRPDLLTQYGPKLISAAVDEVADYVGDVDEIGSSDVSGWVNQVERMLKENPPEAFGESQGNNFVDWAVKQGDRFKNFTRDPAVYAAAKQAYKSQNSVAEQTSGPLGKITKHMAKNDWGTSPQTKYQLRKRRNPEQMAIRNGQTPIAETKKKVVEYKTGPGQTMSEALGADLINMSDLQFYKELLAVLVIPVAGLGAAAWHKIKNSLQLYRAEDVITALNKKGITVDRSTFEQIKPLLLKLERAIDVDRDGDAAKELAQRIQQTVTWGKLKQAPARPTTPVHGRDEPGMAEAANPAQQAAIAISMKRAGNKPKTDESQKESNYIKANQSRDINESLKRGEYFIWTVYFDDGTKKRIKVSSDEFDPVEYYAKKNMVVVNVDYNWEIQGP